MVSKIVPISDRKWAGRFLWDILYTHYYKYGNISLQEEVWYVFNKQFESYQIVKLKTST